MYRIYEEQPISSPGVWNRHGVPAARGLRLRGHAVQLHGDRRQPDRRAGADGQHRALEARVDGDALRLLHDAALRGGGPAAGRDQPRLRARAPRSATPRSRARDLAGVHFTGSTPVFQSMWTTIGKQHRELPQLPAHRRRDRRQGLHRRAPVRGRRRARRRRSCAARSSTRGRSARPRRALYAPSNLWPELRERLADRGRDDPDGRRLGLRELHGRRHRREGARDAARRDRGGARPHGHGDRGRRRRGRHARAASSSRR